MPSQKYPVSDVGRPVAQGPGNATFQFLDFPGQWNIHTSNDPASIPGWFVLNVDTPQSLTLATGEYLHLRGRGEALVLADILGA